MKKDVDTDQRGCTSQSGDTEIPIDIERNPKIQRVPRMLRGVEANQNCYDPLVVSIGPFHHSKELEITEGHKCTMARQYAKNEGQSYDLLYNKVKAIAGDARNCFSLDSSIEALLDEEKFAKMMFLDGCFILQFIRCFVNYYEDLKIEPCYVALVKRDLLLLENQLPFQILRELMSSKENYWKKMFSTFFTQIGAYLPSQSLPSIDFDRCAHLLDMIHTLLIDKAALYAPKYYRRSGSITDWFSCRSVKELKAAGIHFRPSQGHQFTDVQFESMFRTGLLKLPPIVIGDSTKSMLLNMGAYESCSDEPDLLVSSYISFMDSLISDTEDVKELRSKGILFNFLGRDQQVVDLFNQMADNLVANPIAYAHVKNNIEWHYRNKIKIWLAEWMHTHFSRPWKLAFIGAIFSLVMSVIQTYKALYGTETTPCPCTVVNHYHFTNTIPT